MIALALGLIAGIYRAQGADVGEYCKQNQDCDSDSCLPREPVTPSATGVDLGRPPPPSDPSGVCTKHCSFDTDCPADMACGRVMSYSSYGLGSETSSCIPRAWH
jgi:hypothetical protein